ncbi:diguanylate cyclase [Clostridium sp. DL1XJH146]
MNIDRNKVKQIIEDEEDNIKKILIYYRLFEELENSDLKYSYELAQEGYNLSIKNNFEKGITEGLIKKARIMSLLENQYEAIQFLFDALQRAQKENRFEYLVEIYNLLGNIYTSLNNYDVAYNYYTDALDIISENDYKIKYASVLNNIGELYKELNAYDKALEYYNESLKQLKKDNEIKFIGIPMLNIGYIYFELDQLKKALNFTNKSLDISNEIKDKIGVTHALYQLGAIEKKNNNDEAAFNYYSEALNVNKETGDTQIESKIFKDINDLHIRAGRYKVALANLERSYYIANQTNNNTNLLNIYKQYYQLYERKGDYKNSFIFLKKYTDVKENKLAQNNGFRIKSFALLNKIQQTNKEKEIISLKNNELSKKTRELQEAYNNITVISQISKNIISTKKLEEIYEDIYIRIDSLMKVDVLGIGIYDDKNKKINNKYFRENNIRLEEKIIDANNKNSLTAWCVRNKKEVFINDYNKELSKYLDNKTNIYKDEKIKSIIIYPLIIEQEVLGIITVQSSTINAYTKNCLDMITVLSSYISIAIDNATKSEKLSLEIAERKIAQEELEEANYKLLNLSQSDGLTGIPNRRRFDEYSADIWAMSQRNKASVAIIIIDIDKFKEFNDNYGHLNGDKVIKFVARTLEYTIKRSTDLLARFGGDEFVVILPNTDKQGATVIARRMIKEIKKLNLEHKYSSVSNRVTISMGISSCIPSHNISMEKLLDYADKALYEAKNLGRNGFKSLGL